MHKLGCETSIITHWYLWKDINKMNQITPKKVTNGEPPATFKPQMWNTWVTAGDLSWCHWIYLIEIFKMKLVVLLSEFQYVSRVLLFPLISFHVQSIPLFFWSIMILNSNKLDYHVHNYDMYKLCYFTKYFLKLCYFANNLKNAIF